MIISIKLSRSENSTQWFGDVEFANDPDPTLTPIVHPSYLAVNALKVLAEAECMGLASERARIKVVRFERDKHGVSAGFFADINVSVTQIYNLFAAVAEPHGFTVRA